MLTQSQRRSFSLVRPSDLEFVAMSEADVI